VAISLKNEKVTIIGAGLAGSESAFQLCSRGIDVDLYEMKPEKFSPVHTNPGFAELVCSNSLGSIKEGHASNLLKSEVTILNSLIMEAANATSVPAGGALAVDRDLFSKYITEKLESFPNLRIVRQEVRSIPEDGIVLVASGPLTSDALFSNLGVILGSDYLYFYDAVSPIVEASSIDYVKAFFGARYEENSTDYLNIPLSKTEYYDFVKALKGAEVIPVHDADKEGKFFEACLPIEEMARRGDDTLAFGPMKPVGFSNKKIGEDFFAVLQLRAENREKTMFNLVGFQTRMTEGEQKRVFRMIGALREAKFLRYGKMHRNTFINSRVLLNPDLSLKSNNNIFFAGQITGVEGYLESTASGLAASLYISARLKGLKIETMPDTTMIGSLIKHITTIRNHDDKIQPMNANLGVLKEHYATSKIPKSKLKGYMIEQAKIGMKNWYQNYSTKG
jgi:methylenetetrahydrofolate--tRNA-(uracil-5-)-methyltransferase